MTRRTTAWCLATLALLAPYSVGAGSAGEEPAAPPQEVLPAENSTLTVGDTALDITGDVRTTLRLALADISARPHLSVEMTIHDTTHVYRGVPLYELLAEAGLPEGRDVVRTVVIAGASDGYEAVFSLAELHPEFTDRVVLVADSVGGRPLPAPYGPLRVVVPGETEAARAVWSLSRLEVRTLR